jgi:hypothetical protein
MLSKSPIFVSAIEPKTLIMVDDNLHLPQQKENDNVPWWWFIAWFQKRKEKKNLSTLLSFNTMGMAPYSKTTLLI